LQTFTSALTPAYASDLMVSGQGAVTALTQFGAKQVFAATGLGVYQPSANKVPSGSLDSGLITYGIADDKVPLFLAVKNLPLTGTVTSSFAVDSGSFTSVGVISISSSTGAVMPIGAGSGETFEVRQTLTGSGAAAPTVTRWTLRAYPNPNRVQEFILPIMLREKIDQYGQGEQSMNVAAEYEFLLNLSRTAETVILQIGDSSYPVIVEDVSLLLEDLTDRNSTYQGICLVRAKEIA
jgi:hypothetical protein